MGAGASSTYHETSEEDVKTAVAELSEQDKSKILEALKGTTTEQTDGNTKHIRENKAKLHELEQAALGCKQKLYATRAFIDENRALIMTNYAAAFMGNRQMANQNTEDIFRNRKAIVKHYKCKSDPVKINFAASRLNEARIDYLEHRTKMNAKVAEVNGDLVKINELLIAVNSKIMDGNKEVVEFNSKHIDINTKLLSSELEFKNSDGSPASAEKNQERIDRNTKRIADLMEVTKLLGEHTALAAAKENREHILENAMLIYERRAEIEKSHELIEANAHKISAWIMHE